MAHAGPLSSKPVSPVKEPFLPEPRTPFRRPRSTTSELLMATWTPSLAPVTGGARSSRKGGLRWAFLAAQLALGERMYAAGIDDGRLAAQIDAVDRKILRAETARLSPGPLLDQRRKLILQLAAAALEVEAPLPGADAEYERARTALAALHTAGRRGDRHEEEGVADEIGAKPAGRFPAVSPFAAP